MPGLLDGPLRAIFGQAFGGLLLDGFIHQSMSEDNGKGAVVQFFRNPIPVKVVCTEDSTSHESAKGPAGRVSLIILQQGICPDKISELTEQDQVSVARRGEATRRFSIGDIDQDAAGAAWTCKGTPIKEAPIG